MNLKKLLIVLCILLASCLNQNNKSPEKNINLPTNLTSIGALLDSIYDEDQKFRAELNQISVKYGAKSNEMRKQWEKIRKKDKSNLAIIEEILRKHGWLSSKQIGQKGNAALFLVIQHSNQQTQEKYLPLIRKAFKEGKASASNIALLEDRVALGKGRLQIYGSQIGSDEETGEMYVLPLIDPQNVNQRRVSIGLDSIDNYLSYWKLEWDVEDYMKKLPKRMEKLNLLK